MILAYMDDAVLVGGIIHKIRFSKEKDRVYLDMRESKLTLEFRNGKKNRADLIRKMRYQEGETIISVAGISKASQIYAFGWEIQREGMLSSGYYCLIKGTINRIFYSDHSVILLKVNEKMTIYITTDLDLSEYSAGNEILCLCYKGEEKECLNHCSERTLKKCSICSKKKSEKKYYAIQAERIT